MCALARRQGVNADPNVPLNQMPGSLGSELPHSAGVLDESPQDSEAHRYTGVQLWMRRLAVLMFVFLCAAAGVLLVILPWRPEWTDNHLLLALRGFARLFLADSCGACAAALGYSISGLGSGKPCIITNKTFLMLAMPKNDWNF